MKTEGTAGLPRVSPLPEDHHDPESVRAWIRLICDALDINPTELARRASVAQTTLNRFLSGKGLNKNLSGSTISSLSQVLHEGKLTGQIAEYFTEEQKAIFAELRVKYKRSNKRVRTKNGHNRATLSIEGFVGKEVFGFDEQKYIDNEFKIVIPVSHYIYARGIKGYELREEENKIFPYGTILGCVSVDLYLASKNSKTEIRSGIIVVKSVADGKAKEISKVIYKCEMGLNGNWWLIPTWKESRDEDQIFIGKPLFVEGESLEHVMVVVASVRPEA